MGGGEGTGTQVTHLKLGLLEGTGKQDPGPAGNREVKEGKKWNIASRPLIKGFEK